MAEFATSYQFILGQEGGYAEDPTPSNHGITEQTAAQYGYTDDMHDIPLDLVQQIYQDGYWNSWSMDEITSQGVATAIFSILVNMGPGNAAGVVQRAMATLGWTGAQDGQWGPATRAGVNALDPVALCQAISDSAAAYYTNLATKNPADAGYLDGWLNRASQLADLALNNPGATSGLLLLGLLAVALVLRSVKGGQA